MSKYVIEFIGTFFLVLTVALTANPIAIGAVLIAMVYMGGYISGGHFNPAVTLAVLLRDKIDRSTAIRYIATQIAAGMVAAVVYAAVKESTFVPAPGAGVNFYAALIIEVLFTFALASVVLHTATSAKTANNQYFGLAIGLTLMAAAFAGGSISGGVYNPAVGVGPILVDMNNFSTNSSDLILYILGPMIGGALAAMVYKNVITNR
jgi:aquaporin Z